jgi:hypothetical protein
MNTTETTTQRVRLVRTGSGTKLHAMWDRSDNGGETWRTGSRIYCGSSNYQPRTVAEATGADISSAYDAIAEVARQKGINPAHLCQKCADGVADLMDR